MDFFGHIDYPKTDSIHKLSIPMEVSGWGFFPSEPARAVEIRLDGAVWHAAPLNCPRPDVVRNYPAAGRFQAPLGFDFRLDWPSASAAGEHRLEFFLLDQSEGRFLVAVRPVILAALETPPGAERPVAPDDRNPLFLSAKARKLERIRPLLLPNLQPDTAPLHLNCLSVDLKERYHIQDTEQVSSHDYDPVALAMIDKYRDGWILDCGAGKCSVYYNRVVNFEIAPYPSTDVLGVGEELPFRDCTFDAVFSLSVLEHVSDPFRCASEIARVMKPGAELYCVAAFLQPVHGFPHHYFNMTQAGMKRLFEHHLDIARQEVLASGLPIWSLSWFLNVWAASLPEADRAEFINMKVADLLGDPSSYLSHKFVAHLSAPAVQTLASTTALFAVKPHLR